MRKTVLLFVAFALTFFMNAKDFTAEQVPSSVKNYFSKNYPSATSVKWNQKDDGAYYRAEFKMNGRDAKVNIANNGTLISSKEAIRIKDIPDFATKYINNNYRNARILSANKKIENNQTNYSVGFKFETDRGYDRHRNVVFDSKGNVLKN